MRFPRTLRALLPSFILAVLLGLTLSVSVHAEDAVGELGEAPDPGQLQSELVDDQANDEGMEAMASRLPAVRTKEGIRSFVATHPFDIGMDAEYADIPVSTPPCDPGDLTEDMRQQAVNAINVMRYVAGLDANVVHDAELDSYAQAAAITMAALGGYTHYPDHPEGMDDDLYQKGRVGARNSNLWGGSADYLPNPAICILGYMDDAGYTNMDNGHRRWLLGPYLGRVGIGHVYSESEPGYYNRNYNATYVTEKSAGSNVTGVAWPARLMPTCLFRPEDEGQGTPLDWTYSCNVSELGDPTSLTGRVTRRNDGKVWNLSYEEGNLMASTDSFGYDQGVLVWFLEGVEDYKDGDVFDVTINGEGSSISYSVEFFDLFESDTVRVRFPFDSWYANGQTAYKQGVNGDTQEEDLYAAMNYTTEDLFGYSGFRTLAQRQAVEFSYDSSDRSVVDLSKGVESVYRDEEKDAQFFPSQCATLSLRKEGRSTITVSTPKGARMSFDVAVIIANTTGFDVNIDDYDGIAYTGSEIRPSCSVYKELSFTSLQEGVDYSLEYVGNVKSGRAFAVFTGLGSYAGQKWIESFYIEAADIAGARIASIGTQTYTGTAVTPRPTVTFNGMTLVCDVDYRLSYSNNSAAGTGTVVVEGINNFSGTQSANFKIEGGSQPDPETTQDMYRLYNPNSGEHFYTASAKERDDVARAGWQYEGVGWVAPATGDPVYRLYNAVGGEHHYTTDASERDMLVRHGWNDEGIGWYSDPSRRVPLYREYNPNAFACNHNYTTDIAEHGMLLGYGWVDEGYAWYGVARGRKA